MVLLWYMQVKRCDEMARKLRFFTEQVRACNQALGIRVSKSMEKLIIPASNVGVKDRHDDIPPSGI